MLAFEINQSDYEKYVNNTYFVVNNGFFDIMLLNNNKKEISEYLNKELLSSLIIKLVANYNFQPNKTKFKNNLKNVLTIINNKNTELFILLSCAVLCDQNKIKSNTFLNLVDKEDFKSYIYHEIKHNPKTFCWLIKKELFHNILKDCTFDPYKYPSGRYVLYDSTVLSFNEPYQVTKKNVVEKKGHIEFTLIDIPIIFSVISNSGRLKNNEVSLNKIMKETVNFFKSNNKPIPNINFEGVANLLFDHDHIWEITPITKSLYWNDLKDIELNKELNIDKYNKLSKSEINQAILSKQPFNLTTINHIRNIERNLINMKDSFAQLTSGDASYLPKNIHFKNDKNIIEVLKSYMDYMPEIKQPMLNFILSKYENAKKNENKSIYKELYNYMSHHILQTNLVNIVEENDEKPSKPKKIKL